MADDLFADAEMFGFETRAIRAVSVTTPPAAQS